MAKKEFKAESKRLLELMINSIYTHKEIFLREIVSNASDAIDKLAYVALTDDKVGLNRSDFKITLVPNKEERTLTVSDNGIGMTKEELEHNLGTIAQSGSFKFKKDLSEKEKQESETDIIGQFGVGFYSAFMVSDKITVVSKAYGSDTAYKWESEGADGYTITECEKASVGTDVIMHIKPDTEEEDYCEYLEEYGLEHLIKKYSDYIHYPIRMEMSKSRQKPKPEDAPEDYKPEWEDYKEWETVNSMVPVWQKNKKDVTEEEYNDFYKQKFGDFENPLCSISVNAEGVVSYKALLYIPAKAPYDYYTRDFEKGLQLYSSGVLIMDKCSDLLPEYFRFVRGVVDTPDVSLNISREMLQHDRQLKTISANIEKKIKARLVKMQQDEPEKYEEFWKAFGRQIKYGTAADYGMHKDQLLELIMFNSSKEGKLSSFEQYIERMPEDQEYIYYAAGENEAQLAKLPQTERILDKGYEIFWCTDDVDEFVMQFVGEYKGKKIKSVNDEDALPETDEEKKKAEQTAADNKDVLDFVKETLGDEIKEARASRILKSHACCLTADGGMSIEMEKYMRKQGGELADFKSQHILELNTDSSAFAAMKNALSTDKELAAKYAKILYNQALLIAGLPIEEPSEYADLVCSLMK